MHRRPRRRVSAALSIAAVLVVGQASTALAHPFGAPLRAQVQADGSDVLLRWAADEDDWVALARHTGAFDEVPAGHAGGQRSGAERIAQSQSARGYLLANLTVTQDEIPCAGEVAWFGDLLTEGVLLRFRCPEQVGAVEVGIEVLTDVHEAYRTVATAPGGTPGRALYTSTEALHQWDLAAVTPAAVDGATAGATAGMAVLVAVATGVVLARGLSASGRAARSAGRGRRRPSGIRARGPGRAPPTHTVHERSGR